MDRHQLLCYTNDISSRNGNVITGRNIKERWDRYLPNAYPQSLHHKVSVKDYVNLMNTDLNKSFVLYFSNKTPNAVSGARNPA